jgi:ribosomal protein S6--L-glutamate ligase
MLHLPALDGPAPIRLGWEEWLALPALGLPALRAKIDTGAKTSALHAFDIAPFGPALAPSVRFSVHPVPGNARLSVHCAAPVIDRREVISSNGDRELRYVVETEVEVGTTRWPIEITLTDRAGLSTRMLLGRQALGPHVSIAPGHRFLQPPRDFGCYGPSPDPGRSDRPLRIAVLSREPGSYSTRRMIEAGQARGHTVDVLDTTRICIAIDASRPALHLGGAALPAYDAVIPRIGASVTNYGAAVLRQFETMGVWCLNGSDGLMASRDKLRAHQVLAANRIGMPRTASAASARDTDSLIALAGGAPLVVKLLESSQGKGVVLAETRKAAQSVVSAFRDLQAGFLVQEFVAEAAGEDIRCLVIGGRVAAAMRRRAAGDDFRSNLAQGGAGEAVRITPAERDTAVCAARAFGLGLAGVDLLRGADGPKVLEVNSSPGLKGIERITGKDIAARIFAHVERRTARMPAAAPGPGGSPHV